MGIFRSPRPLLPVPPPASLGVGERRDIAAGLFAVVGYNGGFRHDHVELAGMHEEVADHPQGLLDVCVVEARVVHGDNVLGGDLG